MADGPEREYETGKDEAWFAKIDREYEMWSANIKRTYDEYQHESLESIRRNRTYVDKSLSDAQQFDNQRQVIANQALQNAVETANMIGKQQMRHIDFAMNKQWNLEPSEAASEAQVLPSVFLDAIKAAVVAAVAEALAKK